ncbi:hypothetical protein BDV26DRAFT_269654 [Aspergillus bertholletiae]|uniref:Uncharacterized protein n=1 Tax=Aspergillus bertholletiae TaxID=1226010 RepID=A0A5N7AZV8_9EURO|nr:hypothetical protein BDV26DRAFT_269654 [Aspergillus bertholletiae]
MRLNLALFGPFPAGMCQPKMPTCQKDGSTAKIRKGRVMTMDKLQIKFNGREKWLYANEIIWQAKKKAKNVACEVVQNIEPG